MRRITSFDCTSTGETVLTENLTLGPDDFSKLDEKGFRVLDDEESERLIASLLD